jgi:glyoxylase-like metal-dependent hydrolase (beta-lactamase superfamily II)
MPKTFMDRPQVGHVRVLVGDAEVTIMSDGSLQLTPDMLTGAPRSEIGRLLTDAHMQDQPLHTSVNIALIRHGGRIVLVDSGCGQCYGPSLNKLPQAIVAAGYGLDQVTDVLITHAHDDHAGGLVRDGDRVFRNATVHIDAREPAVEMTAPYAAAGMLSRFDGATEVAPGIRSLPTPGHTPGHSAYVLQSRGQELVFLGDLLHVEEVQFPDPRIGSVFDSDPAEARRQRVHAFAVAAQSGHLIAAAHVTYPGIGRLAVEGSGYRWWPLRYVDDAH